MSPPPQEESSRQVAALNSVRFGFMVKFSLNIGRSESFLLFKVVNTDANCDGLYIIRICFNWPALPC